MSPRTTNDPKDIRLEVRLSENANEKLAFCSESLGLSKGEVIRKGIDEMYVYAQREEKQREANLTWKERIAPATEKRANMIYREAYQEALLEAHAEKYSELIVDPSYDPEDANTDASEYAKDIAKEAADEAVKDFWNSVPSFD